MALLAVRLSWFQGSYASLTNHRRLPPVLPTFGCSRAPCCNSVHDIVRRKSSAAGRSLWRALPCSSGNDRGKADTIEIHAPLASVVMQHAARRFRSAGCICRDALDREPARHDAFIALRTPLSLATWLCGAGFDQTQIAQIGHDICERRDWPIAATGDPSFGAAAVRRREQSTDSISTIRAGRNRYQARGSRVPPSRPATGVNST